MRGLCALGLWGSVVLLFAHCFSVVCCVLSVEVGMEGCSWSAPD